MSFRSQLEETLEENTAEEDFELGNFFYNEDIEEAIRYYSSAANKGHVRAKFALGELYDYGIYKKPDIKKAIQYYEDAARAGHSSAQKNLGRIYHRGAQNIAKNFQKAAFYFKQAADQNMAEAQYYFALMLAKGEGIEKNIKKSFAYMQMAADQTYSFAQYEICIAYENGEGVEKDPIKAAEYCHLAARQGNKFAQFKLGRMYERGFGIAKDDKQALYWITLAARQGLSEALHDLAVRYEIGRGVHKDLGMMYYFIHLATTVPLDDEFRLFISNRRISNNALVSRPTLLLNIFEKDKKDPTGAYELFFSENVTLSKSYLTNPLIARDQRGPTCGPVALHIGLTASPSEEVVPPIRNHALSPTDFDKTQPSVISLRYIAKRYGSTFGEIFDIEQLAKTTRYLNFPCQMIKGNKTNYIQKILAAIRTRHTVIVPADIDDDNFPGTFQGKATHYALIVGIISKDNRDYFLVMQYGDHYLWSADDLLRSHEKLPLLNPRVGEYYKVRAEDSYLPKKADQIVPKKDIRTISADSSLEKFRFFALALPTKEKNFLELDEKKLDSQCVYHAVQNSDAVMLKLLLEAGIHLKEKVNIDTLHQIAKAKNDPYCIKVLTHTKPLGFFTPIIRSPSPSADEEPPKSRKRKHPC